MDHLKIEDFEFYISDFEDSEINLVRMQKLQSHLSDCEECRKRLSQYVNYSIILDEEGIPAALGLLNNEGKIRRHLLAYKLFGSKAGNGIMKAVCSIADGSAIYKRINAGIMSGAAIPACRGTNRSPESPEESGMIIDVGLSDAGIDVSVSGEINGNVTVILIPVCEAEDPGSKDEYLIAEAVYNPDEGKAYVHVECDKHYSSYDIYVS